MGSDVGDGHYYDSVTGRFLTRDANPNNPNPYVPWNPFGALIGPLGLLALVFGRKKKSSKAYPFLLMFVMLVVLPLGVGMACIGDDTPTPTEPTPIEQPPVTNTPGPTTVSPILIESPPAPTLTPTLITSCPPTFPPGQAGIAYITIDDGPGYYTGAVLDMLAKYQVKATFFLTGQNIERYPGDVQRMKAEGHAIGIHSWDHPAWGTLSTDAQSKQNQDTQQVLYSTIGEYSNLFRAPGGAPTTADITQLYNYNWSHDTFDYYLPNGDPQVVADNVFKGVFTNAVPITDEDRIYTQNISIDATKHNQPIVLMHSIHPVDPPALEHLILGFRERGYSFGILPRPCDSPGTVVPIAW